MRINVFRGVRKASKLLVPSLVSGTLCTFIFAGVNIANADMTWSDVKNSLENGNNVELTNDITFDNSQIDANKDATFDLKGYTVTGASFDKNAIQVTINNLIIKDGKFEKFDRTGEYGSVLHLTSNGNLELNNITFDNNKSLIAGAISEGTKAGTISILNSTFSNNKAGQVGAVGIYKTAIIQNTKFISNEATATTFDAKSEGAGALFLGSISETGIDGSSITDSLFEGNISSNRGGAISTRDFVQGNNTGAKLDITNTAFKGNQAGTTGGAIDNYFYNDSANSGAVKIAKSTFENNSAASGGAIYNHKGGSDDVMVVNFGREAQVGSINISDSTFTGNKATDAGGAIYNEGTLNISGTNTFSNNTAVVQGGAIYNEGQMTITGATFDKNTTTGNGNGGGAIVNRTVNGNLTITNSTFTNNETVGYTGGAVANSVNATISLDNVTFTKNHAKYDGGALGNYGALTINNSKFIDNTADLTKESNYTVAVTDSQPVGGGAISLGSVSSSTIGTIANTLFQGNKSGINGGAIGTRLAKDGNNKDAKLDIAATFEGNEAYENGGAIYNTFYTNNGLGKGDGVTVTGTFTGNKAGKLGGAIYNDGTVAGSNTSGGVMTINNSTFTENTAKSNGGAIANTGTLNLSGTTFDSNKSSTYGGAIYVDAGTGNGAVKTTIKNSTFNKNQATSTDSIGGAIALITGTVDIDNSTFDGNKADYYGAVYAKGGTMAQDNTVKITNSTFKNNTAKGTGAVGLMRKGTIDNVVFEENHATSDEDGAGALFVGAVSELTLSNSRFTGNTSATRGGAVSTRGKMADNTNAKLDITNTVFEGNSAETTGGAFDNWLYGSVTEPSKVYIANSTFTSNTAKQEGGAIYNHGVADLASNKASIVIKDSTFTGNTAVGYGGAIANENGGTLTFDGTNTFSGNTASAGGAISNNGNITNLIAEFVSNEADNGGAIYNGTTGTLNLSNTQFTSNTAKGGSGGAIFNKENGTLTMANSTFTENIAQTVGGAIYNKGSMDIENSTFTGNSATDSNGGAIFNENGGEITFTGVNTFKGNTAKGVANDISNAGTINVNGTLNLDGGITGNGNIYLGQKSLISTLNYKNLGAEINADTIYATDGAKVAFDWGDKIEANHFYTTGTTGKANLVLDGIYVDTATLSSISPDSGRQIQLFTGGDYANFNSDETGTITNIFYNGSKYRVSQDEKNLILGRNSSSEVGLVDAVTDKSGTTVFEFTGSSTEIRKDEDNTLGTIDKGNLIIAGDTDSTTNNKIVAGESGIGGIKVGTAEDEYKPHTLTVKNVNEVSGFGKDTKDGGFVNIAKNSTVTINAAEGGTVLQKMVAKIGGVFVNKSAHTMNMNGSAENRIVIKDNTAAQGGAGANIAVDTDAVSNINYTDFINNKAEGSTDPVLEGNGGALYNYSEGTNKATMNIADSTFTGNEAKDFGGAIYNGVKTGGVDKAVVNITNTIFGGDKEGDGNSAKNGGAIYNTGTLNITDSTFTGNKANIDGGGAIFNTGTLVFNGINTFTGNKAETGYGGAIYNASTLNILNGNFTENSAKIGGAIFNNDTITNITGNFTGNSSTLEGGAIYNEGTIGSSTGGITGNFTNNSAKEGGAIYNKKEKTITSITGNFTGNSSTNNYAGAISNHGTISSITGDFKYNSATTQGGAIYNSNDRQIDNISGNFEGNSAGNGGAITNQGTIGKADGTGKITGNFTNNTATQVGGAIFNGGTIYIADSTFTNNTSNMYGGAISNLGTLTVTDSTFTGNTSTNSGGAIYNAATSSNIGIINITDSTFTGNSTTGGGAVGGAIYNQTLGVLNLSGTNEFSANEMNSNTADIIPNDIYNDGIMNIKTDGLTVISSGISGSGTTEIEGINGDKGPATLALGVDTADIHWGKDGKGIKIEQKSLTMGEGATLDMRNKNPYDKVSLTTFTAPTDSGKNSIIKIDADLSTNQTDQISVSTSAIGNIKLGSVNVMKDADANDSFDLFTGTGTITTAIEGTTTATSVNTYTFIDGGSGVVNYTVTPGGLTLPEAIADATIDSYSLTKNQDLIEDLGTLAGPSRDLVVFGNGNTVDANQKAGVIVNGDNSLLLDDITMKNFTGDAITVGSEAMVDITNGSLIDGNIKNEGDLGIQDSVIGAVVTEAGRVVNITGNIENTGTLDIEDSIVFGTIKNNGTPSGTINTQGDVTILGGSTNPAEVVAVQANTANITNGVLTVMGDTEFNNTIIENAALNMQSIVDGMPTEVNANLGNLTLNSDTTFSMDADLKEMTMSTVQVTGANLNGNTINLDVKMYSGINTNTNFTLDPFANESTRTALKDAINYQSQQITSPIFKYATKYDPATGLLNVGLAGGGGTGNYQNFNPSVMAGAVAAQVGGYLSQLNSYDEAFANMDMQMLMTKEERQAMKLRNKYASGVNMGVNDGVNNGLMTFSPNQFPEETRGIWARPYATFEKVGLKNGPKVENIAYGMFFGGDSDLIELKNGWDLVYNAYASYDGSHQNYDGVSIYQNGGHLGATAVFYKDNFFTGLTANAGASVAEASTMFGNDHMTMLMAGIASKTGYNWELLRGRFIIQPSLLMSYSFVNMFDYTNKAGVRIDSDPLHAIQIAPGLKFIGNLPHGWQPYIGLQMVWNIMDETKFQAANINLPQLSVRPYIQYGIGVQKKWGDRCTGYAQAMIRNGGRTGIGLSAGFRWALGKDIKYNKSEKPVIDKKAKVSLSSVK